MELAQALAYVTELATLMAMAFPIRCACAMAVKPACNMAPVRCKALEARVLVLRVLVRALEPETSKLWDRVLDCVTVPALMTKQFV